MTRCWSRVHAPSVTPILFLRESDVVDDDSIEIPSADSCNSDPSAESSSDSSSDSSTDISSDSSTDSSSDALPTSNDTPSTGADEIIPDQIDDFFGIEF